METFNFLTIFGKTLVGVGMALVAIGFIGMIIFFLAKPLSRTKFVGEAMTFIGFSVGLIIIIPCISGAIAAKKVHDDSIKMYMHNHYQP